jgi:hypothetical protein
MEYNTTRNRLIIPEYGRNIQKMVVYAIEIPDKDERTRFAFLIVSVMGQINPQGSSSGDHHHKLWDHLHVISDFKLDVTSPYEKPEKDVLSAKPDAMDYSSNNITFRHYGKNIMRIIDMATTLDDGPEKEAITKIIATHLKKSYLTWNRESVDDELIAEQLKELSDGKLQLPEGTVLTSTSELISSQKKKSTKREQRGGSYNKQNRQKKRSRY